MSTTKYFLFGALGVAGVLLLTSDRAKQMRDEMEAKAMKKAKKWKSKLSKIGNDTGDTLTDLKELLSSEIEGLSEDARARIESIVNGTTQSATKIKRSVTNHI